jgi:hypothetical protein
MSWSGMMSWTWSLPEPLSITTGSVCSDVITLKPVASSELSQALSAALAASIAA